MLKGARPVKYTTVVETVLKATIVPKSDAKKRGLSWTLAVQLIVAISSVAFLTDARLIHRFMVPVSVCGVLVGFDCVEWARGRLAIFEPCALVGLFGFHFFYLAPILRVRLDFWALYIPGLADWRYGLGLMATLNLIGLLIYRVTVGFPTKSPNPVPSRVLRLSSFRFLGTVATLVSIVTFLGILAYYGGIDSYLRVVTSARGELEGMGLILLVGEAFSLLGFTTVLLSGRKRLKAHHWQLFAVIVAFAFVQFLGTGLRGSRSNTIWPLLIAIVLVYLIIRPISRKAFLVLMLIVGLFTYLYSFYKIEGTEALPELRSGNTSSRSANSGRGMPDLLLGDLGRSDIQALVLSHQPGRRIDPVLGKTYLAGVALFFPFSVWGTHTPESKVEIGTDVLYGVGMFESGFASSRIYGLAGEGILNFGRVGAPLMFVVFGLYVRAATRIYRRADHGEDLVAKLMAPGLAVGAILMLGQDSGNVTFFLLRHVVPLALVTWFASSNLSSAGTPTGQGQHSRRGPHRSGSHVHAAK